MTTPDQRRIAEENLELATAAVRDEYGSHLCAWINGHTKIVCTAPLNPCRCRQIAEAALATQSPYVTALKHVAEVMIERIKDIHAAFGAPGDYGYDSREGKALYALYKFEAESLAALKEVIGG